MGSDDYGETSQSSNNNDGERPFKKAKYAWQVKGRSHLKEASTRQQQCDPVKNSTASFESATEKKRDQNKSPYRCFHHRCVNRILTHSDNFMSYAGSARLDEVRDEIPVSLVQQNPRTYEYYLNKWQARQIAKSFVDNTINRALEKWMVAPFDEASDFVENCDNGGMVEDEGILMAIQSHGLQSGSRGPESSSSINEQSTAANTSNECTYCVHRRNNIQTANTKLDNASVALTNHRQIDLNLSDVQLIPPETLSNESEITSTQNKPVPESMETSDEYDAEEANKPSTPERSANSFEHFDFLDAAVAVAIQKKGLMSNNVDYG